MVKVKSIRRQKKIASFVIVVATIAVLTAIVACNYGYIIPWPERLGWFQIPWWYYTISELAVGEVGFWGLIWVWSQPEEME